MQIKNVDWQCVVALDRSQVAAMASLHQFVGNIEKQIKTDFPSSNGDIDWDSVRSVLRGFAQAGAMDKDFQAGVAKIAKEVAK